MENLQQQLTELALSIARESFGITLDFSHKSVMQVEEILSEVHEKFKLTGDESGLRGIAIEFGAYIISVIEKNSENGLWERNHPDFGEDSFPFYWKEKTIFPYGWCLKRIVDGESDNVWAKYQVIVLENLNK